MSTTATHKLRSGRPRNHGADEAVLTAAYEMLADGGLPAVTIEAVSARSGIAKPTIYRRWPNRTAVAIAAFAARMLHEIPLVDTGDAQADLVETVRQLAEFYTTPAGTVLAQLVAAGVTDQQAAARLHETYFAVRRRELEAIWNRAVSNGAVRDGIAFDDVLDLLFGPILYRLLIGPEPLDGRTAATLAELALNGLTLRPDASKAHTSRN